jgi:hypothetical protein
MYDLALQTNDKVFATMDLFDPTTPTNVTMDLSKMDKFLDGLQ